MLSIEVKIIDRMAAKTNKIGVSLIDRVMSVKASMLSMIWYHAFLLPCKESWLNSMEKLALNYIWKGEIYKVAKKQLYMPKTEMGFNVWHLSSKVAGFKTH